MINLLGEKVHKHLSALKIETPFKRHGVPGPHTTQQISGHFKSILTQLGMDLKDDSLEDTPKRVAKMYTEEVFWGLNYDNFPKCTVIENHMKYDEMVHQRSSVMSLCEHHLVPFTGVAHVGYIPKDKVIGLSKINRIVDFFSRRPQVQERLTTQISATLELILGTEDVAVILACEHMCVKLRGVKDAESYTHTSKMGGRFLTHPALRSEFLTLARPHSNGS